MDKRKGVEGTNAARDKPMSPDSSAQTEHAAWQNGGDVLVSAQPMHAAWQNGGDVLLSAQPMHAAWQNGGDVLLSAQPTHEASVRPAPVRSTAQESGIYGVFQLVFHKVQYANPGLACTPD